MDSETVYQPIQAPGNAIEHTHTHTSMFGFLNFLSAISLLVEDLATPIVTNPDHKQSLKTKLRHSKRPGMIHL